VLHPYIITPEEPFGNQNFTEYTHCELENVLKESYIAPKY
jgi:hypothetical protein